MKKVSLIMLMTIGMILVVNCGKKDLSAVQPGIWQTNYDEVIKACKSDPKPIIADFYTDWCSWCKKMDSTTFQDSTVLAFLKDYYLLKINAEQDTLLAKAYGIVAYPTLVLMDDSGKEIDRLHYAEPAEFIKIIKDYQAGIGTLVDFLNQEYQKPDEISLKFSIAEKYQSRGEKTSAKEYYQRILNRDPENKAGYSDNAILEIGNVYRRAKDFDSADVYFHKYMAEYPNDSFASDAQLLLGSIALKKGNKEEARKCWREFLLKFPTSPDTGYVKQKLTELGD